MGIDWGDGDYARTGAVLAPVADVLLDAAHVAVGQRVLDVACGTGNATLAAAARGAVATGIDAASRLVEEAQRRADAAGLSATFVVGEAERLPVADGAFDATLSVFGVIFADPQPAVSEMLRVTGQKGVVGLTTWREEGPLHEVGRLLAEAFPLQDGPIPRWGDVGWLTRLLRGAGARVVSFQDGAIPLTAPSPEAWLADQEEHHPVWRAARRGMDAAAWERLHAESIAVLAEGNEDPEGFRITSGYEVVLARR